MRWDSVFKIGGSLYGSRRLPAILRALARAARRRPLLVVPGGGPFADAVREAWRRHRLSQAGAHRMALLGMDQNGLLLCDLERSATPARTLEEAARALRRGRLPVLLAARLATGAPDLPARWSVTSDSVAAWVAGRARARRLILIKSVGAPRGRAGEELAASPAALARAGIVDPMFARILPAATSCWVVNGRVPGRLEALLAAPGSAPAGEGCTSSGVRWRRLRGRGRALARGRPRERTAAPRGS